MSRDKPLTSALFFGKSLTHCEQGIERPGGSRPAGGKNKRPRPEKKLEKKNGINMLKRLTVLFLSIGELFYERLRAGGKQAVPNFTLKEMAAMSRCPGIRGILWSWSGLNYDCPFVMKHYNSGNMQNLQKTTRARASPGFRLFPRHRNNKGIMKPRT